MSEKSGNRLQIVQKQICGKYEFKRCLSFLIRATVRVLKYNYIFFTTTKKLLGLIYTTGGQLTEIQLIEIVFYDFYHLIEILLIT
jgi:hypothetical protein